MKTTIEQLPPNKDFFLILKVNDEYFIECWMTVFRGFRVTCRRQGGYDLLLNWCAGENFSLFNDLINRVIHAIVIDEVDIVPFMSQMKPVDLDEAFMSKIEKYKETYITIQKNFFKEFNLIHNDRTTD